MQASVAAHGWTGAALDGMCRLDSLLRETIRFYGGNLGERALLLIRGPKLQV